MDCRIDNFYTNSWYTSICVGSAIAQNSSSGGVQPNSVDVTLNVGEKTTINKTVDTLLILPRIDIYILHKMRQEVF